MKIYLMDTNKGRRIFINESKNWYYFAYLTNECDIDKAIEHLKNYIKGIYINGGIIDINKFEHMKAYDGEDAEAFLDNINAIEIAQGATQGDLSTLYFVCHTDKIKEGEN